MNHSSTETKSNSLAEFLQVYDKIFDNTNLERKFKPNITPELEEAIAKQAREIIEKTKNDFHI